MIIPISKPVGNFHSKHEKKTSNSVCDASIPLTFVKIISSGAIKYLKRLNIFTIEDLHDAEIEIIREKIKKRKLLEEIHNLRNQIKKLIMLAKHKNILFFERKAQNNNIKLRPYQRARLIGIAIFAAILKSIKDVILFFINEDTDVFREKAILGKIINISYIALRRVS